MSARNGDKSRFHRERKQKIARRNRTRELMKQASTRPNSGDARRGAKREAVSA